MTGKRRRRARSSIMSCMRSEEHTSELQSQSNLVCRLLLEKKFNELCGTVFTVPRSFYLCIHLLMIATCIFDVVYFSFCFCTLVLNITTSNTFLLLSS